MVMKGLTELPLECLRECPLGYVVPRTCGAAWDVSRSLRWLSHGTGQFPFLPERLLGRVRTKVGLQAGENYESYSSYSTDLIRCFPSWVLPGYSLGIPWIQDVADVGCRPSQWGNARAPACTGGNADASEGLGAVPGGASAMERTALFRVNTFGTGPSGTSGICI